MPPPPPSPPCSLPAQPPNILERVSGGACQRSSSPLQEEEEDPQLSQCQPHGLNRTKNASLGWTRFRRLSISVLWVCCGKRSIRTVRGAGAGPVGPGRGLGLLEEGRQVSGGWGHNPGPRGGTGRQEGGRGVGHGRMGEEGWGREEWKRGTGPSDLLWCGGRPVPLFSQPHHLRGPWSSSWRPFPTAVHAKAHTQPLHDRLLSR